MKTSRLTRFLFGIEGELALKNLKRNRRRYRTTVFSLFISIVLFVSFSTFVNFVMTGGGMYYQEINFDLTVMAEDLSPHEQKMLYEQVASLEGVERCAMVREMPTDSWLEETRFSPYFQKNYLREDRLPTDEEGRFRYYFHLIALGEDEFNNYIAENGFDADLFKDSAPLRGILINKTITQEVKLAEFEPLQLRAGEKLLLGGLNYGEADPEAAPPTFTAEIAAVTGSCPTGVKPSDIGYSYLVVTEESFEAVSALLQERRGDPDDDRSTLQLFLTTVEGSGLEGQIRSISENTAQSSHIHINDIRAIQQEMDRTMSVINIFLYGFITLITLIGVTNIFNTISTNVALRRREFAMLKSMGLTPRGFNKTINYESIFYGLNALLYGLPVSVLISLWMYNGFGNYLGFAFFLPWKEIFICVAGVFIIVFITMLHASSKLKDENIIDALKQENL